MVTVEAQAKGVAAVEEWLIAAPVQLMQQIYEVTEHNVQEVLKPAVVDRTPRRTGRLAGSVTGTVRRSGSGSRGVVQSKVRYVSFVERGTAKHGPAQRMFQRGYEDTLQQVEDSYSQMAVKFAESAH
jgi:Bacteriophage HK97-gp10, putative tail-component